MIQPIIFPWFSHHITTSHFTQLYVYYLYLKSSFGEMYDFSEISLSNYCQKSTTWDKINDARKFENSNMQNVHCVCTESSKAFFKSKNIVYPLEGNVIIFMHQNFLLFYFVSSSRPLTIHVLIFALLLKFSSSYFSN